MEPRTALSRLCDPETLAANARGELTPAQHQALRARLPAVGSSILTVAAGVLGFGFVLVHVGTVVEVLAARDPLPLREHVRGYAFTIPGLHLLAALIALGWAFITLTNLVVLINRVRAGQELQPGRARYADGVIAWDGDGYVARLRGRRAPLGPWDGEPIENLRPGPYRFWFLPRGGWLLSAQPLGGWSAAPTGPDGARISLLGVLASANGFRLAALAANRDGRLDAEQAQGLACQEKRAEIVALIVGIGLIAATPAFWYVGQADIAVLCGIAGVATYIGVLRRPARTALDKDLAAGRVACVEGTARKMLQRKFSLVGLLADEGATNEIYSYDIAGTRFVVSETAYHALVDDLPYRAYYLPRSATLLNLEPLTPDLP